MSNYAQAKLYTDYAIEKHNEEQAWEDYIAQKEQDAANSDSWSLWGSVLGGLIGFVASSFNPYGAYLGYQAGKQAKYLAPEEISDEEAYFESKDVFEGGKFHASAMDNAKNEAILADEQADLAELISTGTDAFSAFMFTEGLSSDLLSAPTLAEGGSWYNPMDYSLPTETFSGAEIPAIGDLFTKEAALSDNVFDASIAPLESPDFGAMMENIGKDLGTHLPSSPGYQGVSGSGPASTLIELGSGY